MRREHWLGLTVIYLGTAGSVTAQERQLPSFVRQVQATTPAAMPLGAPTAAPQIVLPPGTTIVVPPAGGTAQATPTQPAASSSSNNNCAHCAKPLSFLRRDGDGGSGGRVHGAVSNLFHKLAEDKCGVDGCLMPIGCSNFHLEYIFMFGSCRQFHGTGTAAPATLLHRP